MSLVMTFGLKLKFRDDELRGTDENKPPFKLNSSHMAHNTAEAECECSASGALALVLRASAAAGASPLRLTRARALWRVAVSAPRGTLYRLIMTVVDLIMIIGLTVDFCQEPKKRVRAGESTMRAVIWICDMVMVMLIANIAVFMGPARMKSLILTLRELQQINFDLKMSPPSPKSEKRKSAAIVCMLLWSFSIQLFDIYNIMDTCLKENKWWPILIMYTTYYYSNMLGVLMVLQWTLAALGVHAAITGLNHQLYQLRHANLESEPTATLEDLLRPPKPVSILVDCFTAREKAPASEFKTYPSQAQATIRRLALFNERINEVVRRMNATNGTILLAMLMSIFLRLVLTPYYMLLGLFDDDDVVVPVVAMQINWSIFHVINLLLVVEPCHWAQEQRERTEILISQLMVHLSPSCERISRELDQFAKQVLLGNAKFMPLGVYTLARPLMATILGGVTTYLVIIIQFQKISDLL